MLAFLQRWVYAHDIRLKLFNPCRSLPDRLEYAGSIPAFEMATLDEMLSWPVPVADMPSLPKYQI